MKHGCTCLIAALAALGAPLAALGDDGARKLTSAERVVAAEGAAWSMVIALSDGSLGLVIQRARPLEHIDACNVAMEWLRSEDSGKTWSAPVTISERRAPDGKLYTRRPDEGYIVYQQRNEAVGQLPDGRIVCAMCELNYFYDKSGNEEPRPGVAWNHENQGVALTWSDDLGETWHATQRVDTAPVGGERPMLSPHGRIVTLADGTHLLAVYGQFDPAYSGTLRIPEGARAGSVVLRSRDNGETWGDPSIIMAKEDDLTWEETALCRVGTRLLAHVRTGRHNVVQYVSEDDGKTWTGPAQVTEPGQQPGAALVLQSGDLLFTWGNRREPFGAAAMLSHDAGHTWDYGHRVMLAWDAVNESCGYANAAQTPDGDIFVTYHAMPATKVYRDLWGKSRVYVLRLTEEQLAEAMRD